MAMTGEIEGYEVCFNEKMGHWYIVQRQLKGGLLHRTSLDGIYQSEVSATAAIAILQDQV